MKIDKIYISNFKGFQAEQEINVDGNNLLIYGENGAGKSSVSEALRIMFSDVNAQSEILKSFPVNIFSLSMPATVKIILQNGENHSVTIHNGIFSNSRGSIIRQSAKIRGILTYKQLLEIYLLPYNQEEINIYNILINNLLLYNINPVSNNSFAVDFIELEMNMPKRNTGNALARVQLLINGLNAGIKQVLKDLHAEANDLLNYFDYNIQIKEFDFSGLRYDNKNHCIENESKNIKLNIDYFDSELKNLFLPHILNEAKLTAMAICIYLGAIKTVPEPELKVLILDDIMIGLDMGNRMPLTKIINEQFAEWQVFLMTYDRFWFENLKRSLPKNWNTAEMYVDKQNNHTPVVIQPSLSDFQKAQKYFLACDFPASANYLRKAFEEHLINFLPNNLKMIETGEGEIKRDTVLDSLWGKFSKLISEINLTSHNLKDFNTFKALLLNPLSHFDPSAPVYATEIENAIDFYQKIRKFEFQKVAESKSKMVIDIKNKNGEDYKYSLHTIDHLYILKYENQVCGITNCKFKLVKYVHNEQEISLKKCAPDTIKKIIRRICHFLEINYSLNSFDKVKINGINILDTCQVTFYRWLENYSKHNDIFIDLYNDSKFFITEYPEQFTLNSYKNWIKFLEAQNACEDAKEILRDAFKEYYTWIKKFQDKYNV